MFKKIIFYILGFLIIVSIVFIVGSLGSLEREGISFGRCVLQILVGFIFLGMSTAGFVALYENYYHENK